MIASTSFILFGKRFELMLDTEDIDRNHEDEDYAYWIVERDGFYFEVNIWKDEKGNYTADGVVYGFTDYEDLCEASDPAEETETVFILS